MHLDLDHTVVVEWLEGIWRQKHRCFEVGNVRKKERMEGSLIAFFLNNQIKIS